MIDILPPKCNSSIHPKSLSISISDLRELACFMSSLDFFICADTGPMHLASASFTPVIAFFNATSDDKYGPLGENDHVVKIIEKSIDVVVDEVQENIHNIKNTQLKNSKVMP